LEGIRKGEEDSKELADVAEVDQADDSKGPGLDPSGAEKNCQDTLQEIRLTASECFQVFKIRPDAAVVYCKLERVSHGLTEAMHGVCKELLRRKKSRKVFFDFTQVEVIPTGVLAELVQFKNTAVHLDKSVYLIAGAKVRAKLKDGFVDRVLEIHSNVYEFVASEIRFVETPRIDERQIEGRGWWRRLLSKGFAFLLVFLLAGVSVRGSDEELGSSIEQGSGCLRQSSGDPACLEDFPKLEELEALLPEAPDVKVIRLEIEKEKMGRGWIHRITVRANYSQHFSSFVPFVPIPELAVAGGTFVGVSFAIPLAQILGRPMPVDLSIRVKELDYERRLVEKRAELRRLYYRRLSLVAELESLGAQSVSAGLRLEKVRRGMELMEEFEGIPPFVFDPIDLAQAEGAGAGIDARMRQTRLEILTVEAEIEGLLGIAGGLTTCRDEN
jgi:hypothetical protein